MADTAKKVKVLELYHTCSACPSQWEGKTADGQYIYVRYRWGQLTIGAAKTFPAAVWEHNVFDKDIGDGLDGYMPYEEMIEHTKGKVDWLPAEEVRSDIGGVYRAQWKAFKAEQEAKSESEKVMDSVSNNTGGRDSN